jgi:pyruvate dehydrogenase kinase 2/3/4
LFASFTSEPLPPGPEITDQLVSAYASRKARPVSLQEMMVMGSNPAYLLTAAQWLWEELPVRLAKRLRDLDDLPFGLSKSVEVQSLAQLYRLSLRDALACPRPQNSADELRFTEQVLKRILVRHQEIVVDLAAGINLTSGFLDDSQLQPVEDTGSMTEEEGGPPRSIGREDAFGERPLKQHFILQEFLDNFNAARIGLRLLMAQHVALHNPPRPNFVGVIQRDVDPAAIVARAAEDATAVCKAQWGVAPAVEVIDQAKKQRAAAASAAGGGETSGGGITNFHYVPAHLRAMLFELLKNAMHATVEHARFKRAASVVPGTAPALDHVRLSEGTPPATSSSPSSSSSATGSALSASSPSSSLPPSSVSVKALTLPSIRVVIVDGATDVTIKVSDEGGGIRRQDLGRVFTYTYSAVQRSRAQRRAQQEAAERQHKKMCEAAEAAALAQGNANGASAAAAKAKMDGIAPSAKLAGAALASSASSPTSSPSVPGAPAAGTAAAASGGGGEASPVLVAAQTLQQRNGDFSWLTGSNFEPVLNTAVNGQPLYAQHACSAAPLAFEASGALIFCWHLLFFLFFFVLFVFQILATRSAFRLPACTRAVWAATCSFVRCMATGPMHSSTSARSEISRNPSTERERDTSVID